jgi:glycyl-tRNA synthetase beta chain
VNFVRPAHGLVALHGGRVVPVKALGPRRGPRHAAATASRPRSRRSGAENADSYARALYERRRGDRLLRGSAAEIARQLARGADRSAALPADRGRRAARRGDGAGRAAQRAHLRSSRPEFLDVPQECLILTMKANQKYFPLLDAQRQVADPPFPGRQQHQPDRTHSAVIGGNERVVRPRLADAKFFFDQDRKKTLASRVDGLGKVVYHNKLGTPGRAHGARRAIAPPSAAWVMPRCSRNRPTRRANWPRPTC